jgi:hypothetical protein
MVAFLRCLLASTLYLTLYPSLLLAQTPPNIDTSINSSKSDEKKVTVVTNAEVVSNFIWRGIDIGGDMLHRRNGDAYKSYTFSPAIQPTIDVFSPSKNFQFQLFGSFQLMNRDDRDSDRRLYQTGSGGVGPSYISEEPKYWDAANQDTCAQNMQTQSLGGQPDYSACGNRVPGRDIAPAKEPNGLRRTDGLFTAFIYNFDESRFGQLSAGIWFYNTFNKSPAFAMAPSTQTANPYASGGTGSPYSPNVYNANNTNAITRLSWHEYFIFWKLPFLQTIEPTFSIFTQYSTDNGGYMAGKNYLSFSMSHEFRKDQFFRITPSLNIGYAAANNLIDNRNGIQDITGSWTFSFGDFFTRIVGIYRPDLYIWDTNNAYGYAGGDPNRASWNRTSADGLVPNPERTYGADNTFVLNAIESLNTGNASVDTLAKIYLREKFTLQKIPQHLLYYSFGITKTF